MPVIVVDASAACALLFREPDGAAIAARLQGSMLVAPTLLPYEVANVCLTKIRRGSADRNALVAAFGLLSLMDIKLVGVEHDEAVLVAERLGLTAYDASYLWLAEAVGGDLVTLDAALAVAWKRTWLQRKPKS